jgi:SecD/SecF fusion protein
MEGLLDAPDLVHAIVLTADLRKDSVAELGVEAGDADSAVKLKELIDGALAAGKSSFGDERDTFAEGFPPGVGPWLVELVGQVLDGVTLAQEGEKVAATLKRPEALAKLPEVITLMAEAKREERRRVERRVQTPGEVGMIVVYEVDADKVQPGSKLSDAGMQPLLAAIDRRLNPAGRTSGRVRPLDDGRIEVSIFRAEPEVMQRIADLLPRPGTLEFRILANDHDHPALIERAKAEPDSRRLRDNSGNLLGWWVPVQEGKEKSVSSYKDIATRTVTRDDREVLEVLVVKGPFDVTGAYLKRAVPDVNPHSGRDCVAFTLDATGGQRFGRLTESNLPDEAQGVRRALGIMVDGELFSAPIIMGKVSEEAQITGDFTQEEAQDLADLLNAGSLPVAIRKVEQRVVDAEQQPSP